MGKSVPTQAFPLFFSNVTPLATLALHPMGASLRATRLSLVLASMCRSVAARCSTGSRSDCDDNGICTTDPFYDHDPTFNRCKCDACYVDRYCGFNICAVIIPILT